MRDLTNSTPPVAVAALPVAPGYTVRGHLGSGGFGDVWDAFRTSDARACAVKIGHRSDAIAVERFRREADALARVGTPHAPALYGSGVLDDGRPFIAMERIEGRTLGELIEDIVEPLPAERVCAIGNAVLAALEGAHVRGVVHRDLKPDNVFLIGGRAILTDFGIATDTRAELSTLTPSGVAVGTAEYMSPEQIAGGSAVDERSDLYSFGVLLYELVTLRVPFGGETTEVQLGHSTRRPPRPGRFAAVPRALERLILDCLAKRPADRPASAGEARRRLAIARADSRNVRSPRPATAPRDLRMAGAAQPAIIAVIESDASAERIADLVRTHQGFVARHRGTRYVAVFTSLLADDPLAAGMTAARELAEAEHARVGVHLSELVIRRRARGDLAAYGKAIENPDQWLPQDWAGVWVSPMASDPLAARGDIANPLALVGRDDALATLATSATAAFGDGPGLLTIVGEHGTGKTRLAVQAARVARERGAEVIDVTCRPPVERGTALLRALAGASATHASSRPQLVRAIADCLRERATERRTAVIIDDAHFADDTLLDALEYVSLTGDDVPLWIVATARPQLKSARPAWGERAHRNERIELSALDDAATRALAADCLRPAEYPPADLLARVARWSGGNPRAVIDLVHALKRDGIVRQREGTGGWFVATTELDRLETSPAGPWLAARLLDELPPELASTARVCAVLGEEVTIGELEWMLDELDRAGVEGADVDARVGLEQLVLRGVVVRAGDRRYAFNGGALRAAIYQLMAPDSRERLHRCALSYCQGRDRSLDRIARHARACGERAAAVDAHIELGDAATDEHAHCRADRHYTEALELLSDGDERRRAHAHFGRGSIRYRIDRAVDAAADLAAAAKLAADLGDESLRVAAELERATALDWAGDYPGSGQILAAVGASVRQLADPALIARLEVGRGRTLYREQRVAEAAIALARGADAARAAGELESEIIALLMLGPALVMTEQLESARQRYEETLDRCAASGDPFHLCAAYANRLVLWIALLDHDAAVGDLRRAMQLAREIGHSVPEIATTTNLSELLFWRGDDDEALELAMRARGVRERLTPQDFVYDTLLLARIHAARDNDARARELLEEIEGTEDLSHYTAAEHALRRAVALHLGGAPDSAWGELIADGAELPLPQYLELLFWRARCAISRGDTATARVARQTARQRVGSAVAWTRRFDRILESAGLYEAA